MINEVEYLKRCEKIREEIVKQKRIIEELKNNVNSSSSRDAEFFINGKIKGLEYSYNIMKQVGIYK